MVFVIYKFSKIQRDIASKIFADVAKYTISFGLVGQLVSKSLDLEILFGISLIAMVTLGLALTLPSDEEKEQ